MWTQTVSLKITKLACLIFIKDYPTLDGTQYCGNNDWLQLLFGGSTSNEGEILFVLYLVFQHFLLEAVAFVYDTPVDLAGGFETTFLHHYLTDPSHTLPVSPLRSLPGIGFSFALWVKTK